MANASEVRGHIRALNDQFADFIQSQRATNSFGVWSAACKDYIKYVSDLEKEFSAAGGATNAANGAGLLAASGGIGAGQSQLFMFGTGDCGQLGFGEDVPELPFPKQLVWKGLSFEKLVCGGMHTVAVSGDGTVWSWGVNDEGALGRYAKSNNEFRDVMGLSGPITADMIPENVPGKVDLPPGSRVSEITAGDSHCMALLTSGEVWGWGSYRNSSGVLGFSATTKIQKLPTKVQIPTLSRIVEVASGADHVLALSSAGEVFSWGCSEKGRLGRLDQDFADTSPKQNASVKEKSLRAEKISSLGNIKHVACGFFSSFALESDGKAHGWGLNNYGQLSLPEEGPFYSPQPLDSLTKNNVKRISGGEHHTLALTHKGKVLGFGRPTYGRLGRSDVSADKDAFVSEPNFCEGISGRVESIETGMAVSGAVTTEGDVYVWGYGTTGQLGKGEDEEDEILPYLLKTKRLAKANVQTISFGGQHAGLVAKPKAAAETQESPQRKKRLRL